MWVFFLFPLLLFHDKNQSVTGVDTITYSIMTNVRVITVRCISLPHMLDYNWHGCWLVQIQEQWLGEGLQAAHRTIAHIWLWAVGWRQTNIGDKILKIRSSINDQLFSQNTENHEKTLRSGLSSSTLNGKIIKYFLWESVWHLSGFYVCDKPNFRFLYGITVAAWRCGWFSAAGPGRVVEMFQQI